MCDDCQQRMAPATARAIEAVTSGTHAAMLAGAGPVHEGLVAITDIGEMKYTYPAAMARPNTVAVYSLLEALGYTISEVERSRLQPPGSES